MNEGSSCGNRRTRIGSHTTKKSNKSLCQLKSHHFATIKNTSTFVDKTRFIKTFLTDSREVILLTGPRAFGKTSLMNMLKQFLLGKTSLFKGLNIYTEEKEYFLENCKLHPVIHIDFSNVSGSNFAEVKEELALAINDAFDQHKYLVKKTDGGKLAWASEKLNISHIQVERFETFYLPQTCITLSEANLKSSLKFLSKVLHTHYEEKVFILIDEYDAPAVSMVLNTSLNKDDIQLVDNLLESFMANTLKFNDFRGHSLIFACVRLAGAFSGNAARIITHYPFLSEHRYAPYLGFTYEEVERLLQIPEVKNANRGKKIFQVIKKWYDGYIVSGDSNLKIFSSWSVLNLLDNICTSNEFKYLSYWIDTGHIKNLQRLFVEPSIREQIEEIISRGKIKIVTVKSITLEDIKSLNELINCLENYEIPKGIVDLFLQFLADSGYFNILPDDEKNYEIETDKIIEEDATDPEYENIKYESIHCILKIPNFEIQQHLKQMCYSEALKVIRTFYLKSKNIKTYLNALKVVLESSSEEAFVDLANAVLGLFASARMISNESELHHILYTVTYNSRCFVTESEVQIKKKRKTPGRAPTLDVIIIMKKNGIIFEYKMNSKSAEKALEQIFKNDYHTKFDERDYAHISNKIYAGLAFNMEGEEKKVFITYKVGNEGESKSVCSD